MTKVNLIMMCETIQEAITKTDWQVATMWANNLAASLNALDSSAKAPGDYETVSIDSEKGNSE